MRVLTTLLFTLLAAGCTPHAGGYHLAESIPVPGEGGWDDLTMDAASRRVYIAHNTQVDVLDADSGKLIGKIPNTNGVHDIAIASDLGRGFSSNGKTNSVTVFDLRTLKTLAVTRTGKKPDAIIYEPATRRVFAFNADGDSATVINARNGKTIGTMALGGAPEFAIAYGPGVMFVNLEDKNVLLKIDSRRLKVTRRWALAPGELPTSLAADRQNHRLFVGCRNKFLLVVNADTGQVIATLPIGDRVDSTAFDPATRQIISTNGDGTITVIHEDTPDRYHVTETVASQKGARTFALDEKTHRLFVPAAQFNPVAAPTRENPKSRPTVIPGSFKILVFENH